jgi:hypothetical protein
MQECPEQQMAGQSVVDSSPDRTEGDQPTKQTSDEGVADGRGRRRFGTKQRSRDPCVKKQRSRDPGRWKETVGGWRGSREVQTRPQARTWSPDEAARGGRTRDRATRGGRTRDEDLARGRRPWATGDAETDRERQATLRRAACPKQRICAVRDRERKDSTATSRAEETEDDPKGKNGSWVI